MLSLVSPKDPWPPVLRLIHWGAPCSVRGNGDSGSTPWPQRDSSCFQSSNPDTRLWKRPALTAQWRTDWCPSERFCDFVGRPCSIFQWYCPPPDCFLPAFISFPTESHERKERHTGKPHTLSCRTHGWVSCAVFDLMKLCNGVRCTGLLGGIR